MSLEEFYIVNTMQLYLANNGEIPGVVEHPPEGRQLSVGDGVVAAELLPEPHGNRQAQNVGAFRTLDVEVQSSALSLSPVPSRTV